jgi:hypothetical protein
VYIMCIYEHQSAAEKACGLDKEKISPSFRTTQ